MLDDATAVDSGGFDQYNEQRIYTGDRSSAHTSGDRERAEHRARGDASVRHHERDGAQRPRERNGAQRPHERDDLADQHCGRDAHVGSRRAATVSPTRQATSSTKRLSSEATLQPDDIHTPARQAMRELRDMR